MAKEEIKTCPAIYLGIRMGGMNFFLLRSLSLPMEGARTRKVPCTKAVHLYSSVHSVLQTCAPGQAVPLERQLAREISWNAYFLGPQNDSFFDRELSIAIHAV